MSFTVITYGGGDILKHVFNSLAILFGNGRGIVYSLSIITLSISALWFLVKAFFSSHSQTAVLKYFFPLLAVVFILMIPKTSIRIEDVLKDASYKVDNIPYIVAKVPEIISSIGYHITKAVEETMHTPNDSNYLSTGMIFGAQNALDFQKFTIKNGDFSENMQRFAKQCIAQDLALGQYTLEELSKERDIWDFLKKKTSKLRMIRYKNIQPDLTTNWEYRNCQEAINEMSVAFEKEKDYYSKQELLKYLPATYQSLTGLNESAEDLVGQQLMICYLKNELNGLGFAKARAKEQQRNTYQIVGALASTSLVTMRSVLEALLYVSVIFILPMALFPGGIKYVGSWLWMLVWIQMWPPFYAVLHYVMQIVAQGQAFGIFNGLQEYQKGLSLYTSIGIEELHNDIYALCGYLSASIPFITYAILKGGVASFIHLAGSMMTPVHNAASSAAAEASTGNYSFANTSFGQMSYKNTSAFQETTAPSLSTGYIRQSDGVMTTTHSPTGSFLQENRSHLKTSLTSTDSIVENFQRQEQELQSLSDNLQKGTSESISTGSRKLAEFTESLTESQNYSENYSVRDAASIQESARSAINAAETVGKQHNLSGRDSLEIAAGFSAFGTGTSKAYSALSEEAKSDFQNLASSQEFQYHMQKITDFASQESATALNDQGRRYSEGLSESLDQVYQNQSAHQLALNKLNQISNQKSWAESHASTIQRSLDQDFVEWGIDKYGYAPFEKALRENSQEKEHMIMDFVSHLSPSYQPATSTGDLEHTFESFDPQAFRASSELKEYKLDMESNIGEHFESTRQRVSKSKSSIESNLSQNERQIHTNYIDEKKDFDDEYRYSSSASQISKIGKKIYQDSSGTASLVGSYLQGTSSQNPPLFGK